MSAYTCRFVNDISSLPVVSLDLNSGATWQQPGSIQVDGDGFDPGWPELKRSIAENMLGDGDRVASESYGNRTLRVPLFLFGSPSQAASSLNKIIRQLDKPRNILQWESDDPLDQPVFFRTFRSSIAEGDIRDVGSGLTRVTLSILAEPFALGLPEIWSDSWTNDGLNLFRALPTIKGDVAAPLRVFFKQQASGAAARIFNGTALLWSFAATYLAGNLLAEFGQQTSIANDTTQVTADATATNSNHWRISFATFATDAYRIQITTNPIPRGSYRILARIRGNTAGNAFTMQLKTGTTALAAIGPQVAYTAVNPIGWDWVDLGIIENPAFGSVPEQERDYLPRDLALNFLFSAARTSGTGSLDVDCFVALPIETIDSQPARTAFIKMPDDSLGSTDGLVVDTDSDSARMIASMNGNLTPTSKGPEIAGGLPQVWPGLSNMLYILPLFQQVAAKDDKTRTTLADFFYYPRYLLLRGVGV